MPKLQNSNLPRHATNNAIPVTSRSTVNKTQTTTSSPLGGPSSKDKEVSHLGKAHLSQRSARDDGRGQGQVRFQPPDAKGPPRREVSPPRPQQPSPQEDSQTQCESTAMSGGAGPGRRQSLRPSALTNASAKTNSTKTPAPSFAPPSPRKHQALRSPAQPPSPKTDMPPPPRPTRSSSMRQPSVNARTAPPAAVRSHTRHRSQMVPASAKPTEPTSIAQKSRAQFSTYQQHYSPKKPTRHPTPTPAPPGADSLLIPSSWPDIAALQTELLQLSVFHSTSLQRHADWKSDSESSLRKQYDAVAGQYRSLLAHEKDHQRQLNTQAISCWQQNCQDHCGPHGFPEQIQVLSRVLQEVSDLTAGGGGGGGRYTRAVQVFEKWFQQADHIRRFREPAGTVDATVFIDPLDRAWKEETHALHAKLELYARQLQSLDILGFGEVERLEHSALARVAQNLTEFIQFMTQEIRAMRTLEADLVRAERECVSRLATGLAGLPRETNAPRPGVWSCSV